MSRHTQGSLTIVGGIAAGIFLVAFVALMVLGEYGFSAAAFLAILVSLLAAIVLYLGFGGSDRVSMPAKPAAKPAPAPAPAPVAEVAPVAAPSEPEPAPAPAPAASEPAPVGDATRPAAMDAPRDGKADDLKQIKGIGPKLEKLCNSMGFWHFDQIANWTPEEVAWVDDNLEGFKGRVTRDNWIDQAKTLASGGETEFSKRVEGGDVY
jgi:predicted flap endonuclease-1-like 5' DNA nuclease